MRRYLIALLISVAVVAGYWGLHLVMYSRLRLHAIAGDYLPLWERMLASRWLAVLLSAVTLSLSFGVAHILHVIQTRQQTDN